MTSAYTFSYVQTDVPPGMTLREYRVLRHGRRRRRWRLWRAWLRAA